MTEHKYNEILIVNEKQVEVMEWMDIVQLPLSCHDCVKLKNRRIKKTFKI